MQPQTSQLPAPSDPYPSQGYTTPYPDPVNPQLTQEPPPPYPGTEQSSSGVSNVAYPPVSYPPPQV